MICTLTNILRTFPNFFIGIICFQVLHHFVGFGPGAGIQNQFSIAIQSLSSQQKRFLLENSPDGSIRMKSLTATQIVRKAYFRQPGEIGHFKHLSPEIIQFFK